MKRDVEIASLGQTGFRLKTAHSTLYIDPYLSNSVQEQEADDLPRLLPIPIKPDQILDADWVLITHAHRDHCDLDSLLPISEASPQSVFIGPPSATRLLRAAGIPSHRIISPANLQTITLRDSLSITTIPSAHPEIELDSDDQWRYLGFLIKSAEQTLYHAGDTAVAREIIDTLAAYGPIDIAFIPVNERNFYREQRGIIGNMSVREAFQFAEDICASTVIPTHWDMFAENQVYKEEIELLYRKLAPQFALIFAEGPT